MKFKPGSNAHMALGEDAAKVSDSASPAVASVACGQRQRETDVIMEALLREYLARRLGDLNY
jgi:hypothetical protein